jgi:hypothetical protein
MISQTDIDDWKDEDFLEVVDAIPEDAKKFTCKEEKDGEVVLDMRSFLVAYGKALNEIFKTSIKK